MWWVKTDSSGEERNGFQNRDIGKRSHDLDFGPDFGVDYARFSDPPDIVQDISLKNELDKKIIQVLGKETRVSIRVRNGFVILKGKLKDQEEKGHLLESLYATDGVREIISDLSFMQESGDDEKTQ